MSTSANTRRLAAGRCRVVPEESPDDVVDAHRRGALLMTVGAAGMTKIRKSITAILPEHKSYKNLPLEVSHWKAPGCPDDQEKSDFFVSVDEIQEAALRGDVSLVLKHIKAGAPVNTPLRVVGSDEYLTLLHILACKPDLPNGARLAGELIEARADPNSRTTLGSTPLIYACYHKHLHIVELLLESGAKTHTTDDFGLSALGCAVLVKDIGVDEKELSRVQDISAKIIELLCDYSAGLDDVSGHTTPIIHAIEENNIPAIEMLLLCGAKPPDLCVAIATMSLPVITLLMDRMANPFQRNQHGLDSMELALIRGDRDVSKALQEYISDLERIRHPHLASRETAEKTKENMMNVKLSKKMTAFIIAGKDEEAAQEGFAFFAVPIEEGEVIEHRDSVLAVRWLLRNPIFQGLNTTNLVLALVLPDIWTILEVGPSSLDTLLCVIFAIFAIELMMNLYAFWSLYLGSFGFYTDVIGLISVPLDHSLVENGLVGALKLDGSALMRITKFVKLGARAGRLSRLVKLLRFLPSLRERDGTTTEICTARSISAELNAQLALRVACLVILMVVCIPLTEFWRFPSEDLSMYVWLRVLDGLATNYSFRDVQSQIEDMHAFYMGKNYFPYMLKICMPQNRSDLLPALCSDQSDLKEYALPARQIPIRQVDTVIIKYPGMLTEIYFNFRGPNLVEAMCTVGLITFVVTFIFFAAGLASSTVSGIVLRPLLDLLLGVQKVSESILMGVEKLATYFVKDYASNADNVIDDHKGAGFQKEVMLLKRVMKKVSLLNKIASAKRPVDEFEQLGSAQRMVLADYATCAAKRHMVTMERQGDGSAQDNQEMEHVKDLDLLMESIGLLFDEVELARPEFDNWELDTIEINPLQRFALARSVLAYFDTVPGFPQNRPVDFKTYTCHGSFLSAVQQCYMDKNNVAYHNWTHAVDIAFTLRKLFTMLPSRGFFTMEERFALLVCAFGHDLGHSGLNNAFLVETQNPLAVMYSDKSILQNLGCASMFEIMQHADCNIFAHFTKELKKDLRQLCVSAILYTDLTKHFELMGQVSRLYTAKKELFEYIREYTPDPDAAIEIENRGHARMVQFHGNHASRQEQDLSTQALLEIEDYFWNADVKHTVRNFFLHFADQSNAMKPWELFGRWTELQFQEFFQQGDSERALKMPLQPLNDRARVNIPYVQIQYVTFFVATPTVLMSAMMPSMKHLEEYVWSNLDSWVNVWSEGGPDPDEERRVVFRISHMKQQANNFETDILPSADDPPSMGYQFSMASMKPSITEQKG
eukprot:TRINITY_DN23676_c0_g1_i1.p1 TRINITY_DN23676_c0_g1~~TRINITY_DN23676_c0_g1_i1.p1  ORF type:complete len:1278 (-),score=198.67 TRINITY_DN23676_c0_g1_i1:81-3914(-)